MTTPIPKPDLKFVQTTDTKKCPKCGGADFFNTGYRADNIRVELDDPNAVNDIPKHPIYRCNQCGQLFRTIQPE